MGISTCMADDAQITVKCCTWLFNNMVYLDPFEVHSMEHFYSKICVLFYLMISAYYCVLEFFGGFDCLFTRKLLPNKKVDTFW